MKFAMDLSEPGRLLDRLGFEAADEGVSQETRQAKMRAAEEHFAGLRIGLVALNTAIFLLIMDLTAVNPLMATAVISITWGYALAVLWLRPHERLDVQQVAATLTVLDGGLVAAWIFLTGGIASPFYVLWYVAIGTVAFRYTLRATMAVSLLYTAIYLGLLAFMGHIAGNPVDVLVQTSYIAVVGGLGGLFTNEYFHRARQEESARKEANDSRMEELQEVQERLDRSATLLSDYADRLARSENELERYHEVTHHQLQEPVRDIVRYAQLFERRYGTGVDDQGREYLHFMVDGATRLQGLLRDLATYSEIESATVSRVPVPADRVVRDVLREVRSDTDNRDADVEVWHLPDVPMDPIHLRELLRHLVENAVRYGDPSKPKVEVGGGRSGDTIHLWVRDNGPGIHPRHRERIFHLFQRLQPREAPTGTGVGLALCKKIVERYDGRIWVESEQGDGSTFHVVLPAASSS